MSDKFNIILCDPPWHYDDRAQAGERGAEFKYPVMSLADLMDLNVKGITAKDSLVFMWATWPQLPVALRLMEAWGFTYKTVAFNWVKQTKTGKQWHWGMGNWTRSNSEVCLLGVRGKPKRQSASVHQIVYEPYMPLIEDIEDWETITIEAPVEKHSKKPDIVRDLIVQLCGDIPRVELFARETTPGWATWGNEVPCDITLGKQ